MAEICRNDWFPVAVSCREKMEKKVAWLAESAGEFRWGWGWGSRLLLYESANIQQLESFWGQQRIPGNVLIRSRSEAMRKNRTWFEIQWPEKVRFWCRSSRNLNAAALNSDERMTLFKPILPQTYTSFCIALGLACAMYFAGWKAQSLPWPMQLNSKSPEAWHISCCATLRWQPLGSSVWSRINDGCKTLSNLRSVMISGMLSQ